MYYFKQNYFVGTGVIYNPGMEKMLSIHLFSFTL